MEDCFTTKVRVDNSLYDGSTQTLVLYVTLVLTGEKRILHFSKNDFHIGEGNKGDFPDKEMYKLSELFKGKVFNWTIYSDPNIKEMTSQDVERLVKKTGEASEEITKALSSDERIIERKREELENKEKEKMRKYAREQLRRKMLEN